MGFRPHAVKAARFAAVFCSATSLSLVGLGSQAAHADTSQSNGCLGVTGAWSTFAVPITGTATPNPDVQPGPITLNNTSVSIGVDSTLLGAGVRTGLVTAADKLADIGAIDNTGAVSPGAGVDAVTSAIGSVTLKINGSNTAQGVQGASNPAPVSVTFYVTSDAVGSVVAVYTAISSPPSTTPDPTRTGTLLTGFLQVQIPLASTTWTPTGGNVVLSEQNVVPSSLTTPTSADKLAAPLRLTPKINGAINVPFFCWTGTSTPLPAPNGTLVPAAPSPISTVTVVAPPTITSVSPSALGQGATKQPIVVTGTGFVPGSVAKFSATGVKVVSTTLPPRRSSSCR
jgi:hypothetical protein